MRLRVYKGLLHCGYTEVDVRKACWAHNGLLHHGHIAVAVLTALGL